MLGEEKYKITNACNLMSISNNHFEANGSEKRQCNIKNITRLAYFLHDQKFKFLNQYFPQIPLMKDSSESLWEIKISTALLLSVVPIWYFPFCTETNLHLSFLSQLIFRKPTLQIPLTDLFAFSFRLVAMWSFHPHSNIPRPALPSGCLPLRASSQAMTTTMARSASLLSQQGRTYLRRNTRRWRRLPTPPQRGGESAGCT